MKVLMKVVVVMFILVLKVKVIQAVLTEDWRSENMKVSTRSPGIIRVMLYTDFPVTKATIMFHFHHYQPYAKVFTITQSRLWHIIDISKVGKLTRVRGPVADLDFKMPYRKLLKVSVSSQKPVLWAVCGYACSLPSPSNGTCKVPVVPTTKEIPIQTTPITTTTSPITTIHQATTFTFNATSVITIVFTLMMVSVVFITTSFVLTIYICCIKNNSIGKETQPPSSELHNY